MPAHEIFGLDDAVREALVFPTMRSALVYLMGHQNSKDITRFGPCVTAYAVKLSGKSIVIPRNSDLVLGIRAAGGKSDGNSAYFRRPRRMVWPNCIALWRKLRSADRPCLSRPSRHSAVSRHATRIRERRYGRRSVVWSSRYGNEENNSDKHCRSRAGKLCHVDWERGRDTTGRC